MTGYWSHGVGLGVTRVLGVGLGLTAVGVLGVWIGRLGCRVVGCKLLEVWSFGFKLFVGLGFSIGEA